MADDLITSLELPPGVRAADQARRGQARALAAVRHRGNWLQLVRYGAVGASGFVVNLVVFAVCLHAVGLDYRLGSVIAYLVSVTSNFWLNRRWTFADKRVAHPGHQALKFFVVSLLAYGIQYLILVSLVGAGLEKVTSQAVAVIASLPLSFLGQKLWSFRH